MFEVNYRYKRLGSLKRSLGIDGHTALGKSILLQIIVLGMFCLVAVFGLIPHMIIENNERELLTTSNVKAIFVIPRSSGKEILISQNVMHDIKMKLKNSKVFYSSHEGGTKRFRLVITTQNGVISYDADIPDRHDKNVRLSFKKGFAYSSILVPGLGDSLSEILQ